MAGLQAASGAGTLLNVQFVYALTPTAVRARSCGRSWCGTISGALLGPPRTRMATSPEYRWCGQRSRSGAAERAATAWPPPPPPPPPRVQRLCCWRRPCASPSTPSVHATGWRSLCCAHPCSLGSMQHMAADAASSWQQTRPIQKQGRGRRSRAAGGSPPKSLRSRLLNTSRARCGTPRELRGIAANACADGRLDGMPRLDAIQRQQSCCTLVCRFPCNMLRLRPSPAVST